MGCSCGNVGCQAWQGTAAVGRFPFCTCCFFTVIPTDKQQTLSPPHTVVSGWCPRTTHALLHLQAPGSSYVGCWAQPETVAVMTVLHQFLLPMPAPSRCWKEKSACCCCLWPSWAPCSPQQQWGRSGFGAPPVPVSTRDSSCSGSSFQCLLPGSRRHQGSRCWKEEPACCHHCLQPHTAPHAAAPWSSTHVWVKWGQQQQWHPPSNTWSQLHSIPCQFKLSRHSSPIPHGLRGHPL